MAIAGSRRFHTDHSFQRRGSATRPYTLSGAAFTATLRVTLNYGDSSMPPTASTATRATSVPSTHLMVFIGGPFSRQ